MGRYRQIFRDRSPAKLLLPESAAAEAIEREIGIEARTLKRWRGAVQARPWAGLDCFGAA